MSQIMLSQLVGLISATWETKRVYGSVSYFSWDDLMKRWNIALKEGTYPIQNSITLKWENKIHTGHPDHSIYIAIREAKVMNHGGYFGVEPRGTIYLFDGNNCNSHTQFIYWLMGNEVAIVDDLGLVGRLNPDYSRKRSLCNLSAHEFACWQVGAHKNFWEVDNEEMSTAPPLKRDEAWK